MKKHTRDGIAIIILIGLAILFFYRTVFQGLLPVPSDTLVGMYHPWRDAYTHTFANGVPFKNFLITDPVRQQIPWRKQVIEYWKQGKMPSWDAWSFSGTPLISNIQAGTFYPLNILFFLFSFPVAWTILIISQPLLSGIFMYVFLRNKKLDILSCLIGGVTFSYCGYAVAWLTWGTIVSAFLWTPMMLFTVDKIHADKKTLKWYLLFLFSFCSSFFAGHLQFFAYGMVIVIWYAFWEYGKVNKCRILWKHAAGVTTVTAIAVAITSIEWIPLLYFFSTASRLSGATYLHEGFFVPFQHLVQFIAPDYFGNPATLNYFGVWNYGEMVGYIGVIGLVLALLGIGRGTIVWVIPVILSLIFAVDSPLSKLPFVLHIPVASIFQPTRLLAVISLCLSVLSAYGASRIFVMSKKQKILTLAVVGLLYIIAWIFGVNPVTRRNLLLPTFLYCIAACSITLSLLHNKQKWLKIFLLLLYLVMEIFDLFRFGWKFTPFTSPSYFFPQTETISFLKQQAQPFRVMVLDDRALPPNVLTYYGIESVGGYDPIHSLQYEEFIAAMERGEPNIRPPFGFNRIMTPKNYTSPLFQLLGIKYVIAMTPIDNPKLKKMLEEGETRVYRNVDFSPRAYLAETIFVKKTKQDIMNGLYGKDFIPGRTAIVETELPVVSRPLISSESATITTYTPDKITLNVMTTNSRLVVMGNMFDPGWKVRIDGQRTDTYRVNYLFFGVIVPKGEHKIDIIYLPI